MQDSKGCAVLAVTVDFTVPLAMPLALELQRRGWEVTMVSSAGENMRWLAENTEVRVHELRMERGVAPLRDLLALFQWIGVLANLKPEMVVIGTPKASLLGLLASTIIGIRTRVYMLRGLRLETEVGAMRAILYVFERLTAACAHKIICVSHSLETTYIGAGLAKRSKVVVLGQGSSKGVNTNKFLPTSRDSARSSDSIHRRTGLAKDRLTIGMFGRICFDKGYDVFLEAMSSDVLGELDLQALVIGPDETDGGWSVAKAKLGNNIVELPYSSDLSNYYRVLDVLCLPTRREGFPNVALEAQASGVPVITTDATGAVDSVSHGYSGLIVKSGSSRELALALHQLLTNEPIRSKMALNARQWVTQNFAEEIVICQQADFLEGFASR